MKSQDSHDDFVPTKFMLPTSHYDPAKAERVIRFIQNLKHTKGRFANTPFTLLPWQTELIKNFYGVVKADGTRQFHTMYVELGKKNGKSELAAAIALYQLFADGESSPEVYSAAADRQQASIIFNVAAQMTRLCPALMKRCKILSATKRIVNYTNAGFYQVLSAEVGTKHGLNVSCVCLDEVHTQSSRALYDVLTQGSGDARTQPVNLLLTTAGTDKNSICYELHQKAKDLLNGQKYDPTFYPVIYGLDEGDDWKDEKNWYKANPSLGYTITIDRVREQFQQALQNPAEEAIFKQLRLSMWLSATTTFIPEQIFDKGNQQIDMDSLLGRECYGGLDLSSTEDVTALVLMFPPRTPEEKYICLPFFWVPEDTIPIRVRRSSVKYDIWYKQGYLMATPGNVIDYNYIEKFINDLYEKYNIKEIAVDRWNATELIQNLQNDGFTMVPTGMGYSSMSAPTKEMYKLLMEGKIIHGGQPMLKWMALNLVVDHDAAGNIKPSKKAASEKIDGMVAMILALDRCVRNQNKESVYDSRGLLFI